MTKTRENPRQNVSDDIRSKRGVSALRVALFTDTLGDVNGVSRFIRTIASESLVDRGGEAPLDLQVLTATRFACPAAENLHVFTPRWARAMPGYANLELAWPPRKRLFALADALRPEVMHVSTPGPVGLAGRAWALRRGVPLVGTYHTDFPAYVEHLFDDPVLTWTCKAMMRWFYKPFAKVITRSAEYEPALQAIGVPTHKIVRLLPGIDTETFNVRHADRTGSVWRGAPGVRAESVKALYVGRVSVEKNLPQVARLWPEVVRRCAARGVDVQFIIVGDGPYRAEMQRALAAGDSHAAFLGFRFGDELSRIYASSDVFVFPSTTDTLGQAVMEAQCSGLPVVVTDRGGPKGVVDDGATGFVLPPADGAGAERWTETLTRLLTDAALRTRMGAAAHDKIAPMSIRHSLRQFREIHAQVAAGHG